MDEDWTAARNAGAEATALAGDGAYVLEPSPPAVTEGPWFADDPTAAASADFWSNWSAGHPGHEQWLADRWLAGDRRLPTRPDDLAATRIDLHRLAAYVVAPVRHETNGKFGLRWTIGGFGTPFFGDDRQIRVVGTMLVDQRGDDVRVAPITTLRAAAAFLDGSIHSDAGAESDSPPVGDIDEPLVVEASAVEFLGNWFALGFAALEAVRSDPLSIDASRPQLWPGHFDPAIEVGDEDHRGSYGASPGDSEIDEPYLYVSVWWPDRIGLDSSQPIWNAPAFTGSVLKLSDFDEAEDPLAAAVRFFSSARTELT